MSRWYIIHAYSGFEGKVRDAIMAEATRLGLDRLVEQIEVPTETVTEARRGKKIAVERKFMPGYVLAKLDMTDQVYHLVKNTPKVTGFLGAMGKPQAISEAEATRMLNSKEEAAAAPKQKVKVDTRPRPSRPAREAGRRAGSRNRLCASTLRTSARAAICPSHPTARMTIGRLPFPGSGRRTHASQLRRAPWRRRPLSSSSGRSRPRPRRSSGRRGRRPG